VASGMPCHKSPSPLAGGKVGKFLSKGGGIEVGKCVL
jgi:hypothetical protein